MAKTSGGKASGAGLRGQSAGTTTIATVGKSGLGLTYRGYSIESLAEHAQFEEVAYLLMVGQLPTAEQLEAYKTKLRGLRSLPSELREVLERIPHRIEHPVVPDRVLTSRIILFQPSHRAQQFPVLLMLREREQASSGSGQSCRSR